MTMTRGVMAEFATPEALCVAIRDLRARGLTRLDAFTPYPVHEVSEALALRRSRLTWIIFPVAMAGAGGAYLLQWYLNAVDYHLNVGGRPAHALPAFIIITFEMGVLSAALCAVVSLFVSNRLPQLWHPVFDVEGFERASIDRFWVGVDATDPTYDARRVAEALRAVGAARVTGFGGEALS